MGGMLDTFQSVGRAIADPTRVRILKMLEQGELCVCQVTAVLGLAPATVSKHLSLLKAAGLLSQRKEGRWVYYRLAANDRNPYAPSMLSLLSGVLGDDSTIGEDRRRLEQVNTVALNVLCGMDRRAFYDPPGTAVAVEPAAGPAAP